MQADPHPHAHRCETLPFDGQRPDATGLRKKTSLFMKPHYLENFIQSCFHGLGGIAGKVLVLGGDGRFFNAEALQTLIGMSVANGAARLIVGRDGLLSTPAASCLIRRSSADAGVVLTASRLPGGAHGDFGVKLMLGHGGPPPETVNDAIGDFSAQLRHFYVAPRRAVDLSRIGVRDLDGCRIEIVDPVADYADLMAELFDFDAIAGLARRGFRLRIDTMHGVTGPYARALFEDRLGFASGSVIRAEPRPDFAEIHPDPCPQWAPLLLQEMMAPGARGLGAAFDGDGDRHWLLVPGRVVAPGDSLAIIAAQAHSAPRWRDGLRGVARSLATSRALDRVARALGIPCIETAPGWPHLAAVLEAGTASIGGDESFAVGGHHCRQGDGIWAVLMWLSAVAHCGDDDAGGLLQNHWRRFGRTYATRHDFEALDPAAAEAMMSALKAAIPTLPGTAAAELTILGAEDFSYRDPDGSLAHSQGVRILFEGESQVVLRLSGTARDGATLRLYLERYEHNSAHFDVDPQFALAPVIRAAHALAGIRNQIGHERPNLVV